MVKMLKKWRHLLRIRDNTSEFKHIVGFTSDLKEFWCSFVRLKLERRIYLWHFVSSFVFPDTL
jgi:hypothetical protein